MATLMNISPLVPVTDVLKSAQFFEDYLGFQSLFKEAHYAHLKRDDVSIKLQQAGDHRGQSACYMMLTMSMLSMLNDKIVLKHCPKGELDLPLIKTTLCASFM